MTDGAKTLYVGFNLCEALIWILLAVYLRRVDSRVSSPLIREALPSLFVLFGVTDLAEAGLRGPLPDWLWTLKLVLGCSLFLLGNYRDWIAPRGLTATRLAIRILVFSALLWLFVSTTR